MATTDDHVVASIRDLVAPVAEDLGAEILDVGVTGPSGRRLVRVIADAKDLDAAAGLDIDTIAELSRRAGALLDELDPIAGAYVLEVTSPGVDRPLTRARDFARNRGRTVRVTRRDASEGEVTISGTVLDVTPETVVLETEDAEVDVALADVDHAQVVLPW
jgi:ribosome maturation factor RimP